ncbi:hypothetical protein [Laspinema olomoucense]|uniref:hypothetical protein n=1 Tax=Laspinema olomoucense TaxID=3231600 RepID=UPI0021BB17BC|nr:hypothetical protein [Laspinema sp. D3d]MCT7971151.1 hypothetical protein [Laspinema sp. D3d]
MIHIPRKDELETESVLEQYAKLKKDLVNCQDWLKEIEPKALDEALTILQSGNSLSKGKMVYKGNGLRLVLGQRKKFPNEKSDPMLETLSSQIRNAELAEIKRNSAELNQITDQIESLRAEIEKLQEKEQALKQNDYIIGLKAQYSDRQQKGEYYEPYLITYQE